MVKSINIIGSYVGCAYIACQVQNRILIQTNVTATAKTRAKLWILLQWGKSNVIMLSSRCRHYLSAFRVYESYKRTVLLILSNLVRVYEGMEQGTVAGRVVLKMD